MSSHDAPSPPPITYTARPALSALHLTCDRCQRVYAYPADGGPAIRCECGWRYENRSGVITEEFAPRLGV